MSRKKQLNATLIDEMVLIEKTDVAMVLYDKSSFGNIIGNGRLQLSLLEALYLIEKKSISVAQNL